MRLSRTYRAVLVFLFVGFLGATGPAIDGMDPTPFAAPQFTVWMEFDTTSLFVEATHGDAGAAGILNFHVINGPTPGLLSVPFTFDAVGQCRMTFPLSLMNNGMDLAIGVQLVTVSQTGSVIESPIWALTSKNYVVTDPSVPPCPECPTAPGGWVDWVTWPGTQSGTLYPHCMVAIESEEGRSSGQPMLALESGPAGSFPIN
jgi:hypothetical protein